MFGSSPAGLVDTVLTSAPHEEKGRSSMSLGPLIFFGSGGRIRTDDLRVMTEPGGFHASLSQCTICFLNCAKVARHIAVTTDTWTQIRPILLTPLWHDARTRPRLTTGPVREISKGALEPQRPVEGRDALVQHTELHAGQPRRSTPTTARRSRFPPSEERQTERLRTRRTPQSRTEEFGDRLQMPGRMPKAPLRPRVTSCPRMRCLGQKGPAQRPNLEWPQPREKPRLTPQAQRAALAAERRGPH